MTRLSKQPQLQHIYPTNIMSHVFPALSRYQDVSVYWSTVTKLLIRQKVWLSSGESSCRTQQNISSLLTSRGDKLLLVEFFFTGSQLIVLSPHPRHPDETSSNAAARLFWGQYSHCSLSAQLEILLPPHFTLSSAQTGNTGEAAGWGVASISISCVPVVRVFRLGMLSWVMEFYCWSKRSCSAHMLQILILNQFRSLAGQSVHLNLKSIHDWYSSVMA